MGKRTEGASGHTERRSLSWNIERRGTHCKRFVGGRAANLLKLAVISVFVFVLVLSDVAGMKQETPNAPEVPEVSEMLEVLEILDALEVLGEAGGIGGVSIE